MRGDVHRSHAVAEVESGQKVGRSAAEGHGLGGGPVETRLLREAKVAIGNQQSQ